MDPNKTLASFRAAIAKATALDERADKADEDGAWDVAGSLRSDAMEARAAASEDAAALDEWLSRGGFLPDAWHVEQM